jgi:hypothetical protein
MKIHLHSHLNDVIDQSQVLSDKMFGLNHLENHQNWNLYVHVNSLMSNYFLFHRYIKIPFRKKKK